MCNEHYLYWQTYIGPILISVNPYTDTGNPLTLTGARAAHRVELARLVRDAVRQQADTGYPQAIILSGTCATENYRLHVLITREILMRDALLGASGSGKTYAAMLLLRLLFDEAGGGAETDAFKHLAAAFTVLRALGTAATPANSNSTRIVCT